VKVVAVLHGEELTSLRAGLSQTWGSHVDLTLFQSDMEAAEAIVEHGRPDLLVVDLDMPGVVGLEIVRSLREQPELETMPILVVTSRPERLDAMDSGRTLPMPKPVPPEAWKEAVRRALAVPRSHEAPLPRPQKARPETAAQEKGRRGSRKPFEASCSVSTGGRRIKGNLHDISISGAKIQLDEALTVGSMVSFSFAIPRTVPLKFLHFKARVVRQTEDGYGITFWEMDTVTRTYLNAVVR
jgi:DNA-binding response OmpR family regulator